MTTESELIALAGKLTKAQADALIKAEIDGTLGRYFSRFISVPAGRGLVKAGLATAVWSGVVLSKKGEALRNHLRARAAAQVSA